MVKRLAAVAGRMRSELGMAVAMAVLNVATYAHTVLAARYLGPESFGAFTAAMNALIVLSVVSLGLQTTVARRVAASPDHRPSIARAALRLTYRSAAVLGVVLTLASPVVDELLRLDSSATALLIALGAVPMTIMGGQAGVLQGERRWGALASVYAVSGLSRLLVGTALLLWRPALPLAVAGIVVGLLAPVVLGWFLRGLRPISRDDAPAGPTVHLFRESLRGAQALLAFLALSNLDVVVARHALADDVSGLYAAGLVLTKAVLFLPQFVLVRAFPALSTSADRRRALTVSVGVIVLLGVAVAATTKALSAVALLFVGGDQFDGVEELLWLFALLGTVQALVQLFIYSVLARGAIGPTLITWAALGVMVALGLQTDTLAQMASVAIGVNVVLLIALVALTSLHRTSPASPPLG